MEHGIELNLVEQSRDRGLVEEIELDESKGCRSLKMGDVASPAQPQIVETPYLFAPIEQAVAKMAADKAGTACDKNNV
jgi:hypothetical protein